jgi:hypothetical protein
MVSECVARVREGLSEALVEASGAWRPEEVRRELCAALRVSARESLVEESVVGVVEAALMWGRTEGVRARAVWHGLQVTLEVLHAAARAAEAGGMEAWTTRAAAAAALQKGLMERATFDVAEGEPMAHLPALLLPSEVPVVAGHVARTLLRHWMLWRFLTTQTARSAPAPRIAVVDAPLGPPPLAAGRAAPS